MNKHDTLVWLALVAVLFALHSVWLLACVALSRLLRQPLVSVTLGFGPRLIRVVAFGPEVEIRAFPIGSNVRWMPGTPATHRSWQRGALRFGSAAVVVAVGVVFGARNDDFIDGLTLLGRMRDVFVRWPSWVELLSADPVGSFGRLVARMSMLNVVNLLITPVDPPPKWRVGLMIFYWLVVAVGLVWPLTSSTPG